MVAVVSLQALRKLGVLTLWMVLTFFPSQGAEATPNLAMSAEGLITIQSHYGPREMMQKLEAAVKAKGLTVFAHIDHSAQAAEVNLALRR
jgi:hypothetical protein